MATILIIGGPHKKQWYQVTETRSVTLGRDEELLAQLEDRRVSYHHLEIGYDPERSLFFADDLNSRNGVKVNGQRINHRYILHHRDIICIGKTYIAFIENDIEDESQADTLVMELRTHAESMRRERKSSRSRPADEPPSQEHASESSHGSHGFFTARR